MYESVTWKGFQHGINLGGWFSQCQYSAEHFDSFIQEKDIRQIAGWGLDHVRLPIDYNLVLDEGGSWIEDGFQRILQAASWCRKYGLHMVLDLHKTKGFSFDQGEQQSGFFESEELQELFYSLWENLAKRLEADWDLLAFELLNEVTDRAYAETWNRISHECIRRIRSIAPNVPILVGGYWNNSLLALADLEMPYDENLIYNFHCYDPLVFTHQGAPWVDGMDHEFRLSLSEPVSSLKEKNEAFRGIDDHEFDGLDLQKPLDDEYFMRKFKSAVSIAEERHVRLYCGEYGVIDRAQPSDILAWYRAIHAAFTHYGIGRAAWSYKEMDFGMTDARLDPVREQLIRLL